MSKGKPSISRAVLDAMRERDGTLSRSARRKLKRLERKGNVTMSGEASQTEFDQAKAYEAAEWKHKRTHAQAQADPVLEEAPEAEAELPVHPIAALFPMMNDKELELLAEDIKATGLREPIKRHNGRLIDGRNRRAACKQAGVDPKFQDMDFESEADVIKYITSLNIHRRHLNEDQRKLIAAEIATMRQGERTDLEPSANLQKVSQSDAADMMNVSVRGVSTAKQVVDHCDQETIEKVRHGTERLSKASQKAKAAKRAKNGDEPKAPQPAESSTEEEHLDLRFIAQEIVSLCEKIKRHDPLLDMEDEEYDE